MLYYHKMILRIFFLLPLLLRCQAYLLNVPQILLPYYLSEAINFTLKVTEPPGGCFLWRSSRPEVVSITPIHESGIAADCSDAATVSAITKHSNKQTAIVFAEGKSTGVTLRCDVMVDRIKSIEIVTTTRELFLEVAPEVFTVTAKNDMDDTFTTLAGLPFEWTIKSTVKGQQSLRIIPFSESAYETPPAIKILEEKGMRGYQCLMEGVGTGTSTLSVKLKDREYQEIHGYSLTLIVVANLVLVPSQDIYLTVNAQIKYSVQMIKDKKIEAVALPSDQYKLELSDLSIASLDSYYSFVTALQLGTTEIKLIDKHVDSVNISRLPSAYIHVTDPVSLYFSVQPGDFVLQTNETYEISLGLRGDQGQEIMITENMRMSASFDEELFTILERSRNGSYFKVKAIEKGMAWVRGTYYSVILQDGSVELIDPEISQNQKIEIFDPIIVHPPVAAFPYHPEGKDVYSFQYKVSGGSTDFWWSLNPKNIGNMKETSGMVTTSRIYGEAGVLVTDRRNSLHKGKAKLVVVPPTRFQFYHGRVEYPVGSVIALAIQAFGNEVKGKGEVQFTDCRAMPLAVSLSDSSIFITVKDDSPEIALNGCREILLKALKPGEATVTVLYAGVRLQASITIYAYEPLKIESKDTNPLICLGSSWVVKFSGGPKLLASHPSGYFYTLIEKKDSPESENIMEIKKSTQERTFIAACLHNVGSVTLNLTVGNKLCPVCPEPAIETLEFKLCCAVPEQIKIRPELPELGSGIPPCPLLKEEHAAYPLHKSAESRLLLTGFGKCPGSEIKRKFDNISSLVFEWEAGPQNLVVLPYKGTTNMNDMVNIKGLGGEGRVVLKGNSYGYSVTFTNLWHKLAQPVKSSVELDLVEYATVEPTQLSLFNHATNKADLSVKGGSGYMYVVCDNPQHRSVSFSLDGRTIRVSPLKNGVNDLIIYDVCLIRTPPQPLVSTITVAGISKIQVTGPNLMETGQQIQLHVKVISDKNVPVPSAYFKLMNLKFTAETEILTWKEDYLKNDEIVYLISGLNVGHTNIILTAMASDGHKISSVQHYMQVFAPLAIQPSVVYLLTQSVFQLEVTGGPQPRQTVQYSINDTSIAQIEPNGMIRSLTKLGNAKIVGKLLLTDDNQIGLQNSEATIYLHVVSLTGIKIHVPSVKLLVGSSVLLSEPPTNSFSKRLRLVKAGHVTVTLRVTSKPESKYHLIGSKEMTFTDTVTVLAIEPLRNLVPSVTGGRILMAPQSSLQIKMNRPAPTYTLSTTSVDTSDYNRISIDKGGLLKASRAPSIAFLRQEIANEDGLVDLLEVEVIPVSYLMVDSHTGMESGSSINLPLGFTFNLSIQFYDGLGRQFDAVEENIEFRPHRFDLTEIESKGNEISVQLKQRGQTVLKVWTPSFNDFILLSSEEVIVPGSSTIITSGDILCFQTGIFCEKQVWKSSDKSKLVMDSGSAIGFAKNSGAVRIVAQFCHDYLETFVDVTVRPAKLIRFYTASEVPVQSKFMSNLVGINSEAEFAVLLMAGPEQDTNVHGENCHEVLKREGNDLNQPSAAFDCNLEWERKQDIAPYSIFQVTAGFSRTTGTHVCAVKALPVDMYELHSTVSSKLKVIARLKGNSSPSATYTIDFYPAIYVFQNEISLDNLANMQAPLLLSYPHDLVSIIRVTPSNRALKVKRVSTEGSNVKFMVSVLNHVAAEIDDLHITVHNPQTGQSRRIPVKVVLYGDAPKQVYMAYETSGIFGVLEFIIDQYGTALTVFATIFFTLFCVFFGYKYLSRSFCLPVPVTNGLSVSNSFDRPGSPSKAYTRWRTYNSPMSANGYRSSPDDNRSNSSQGSPYLWSTDKAQTSPYYRPS